MPDARMHEHVGHVLGSFVRVSDVGQRFEL
jgi:hypothetical protein